MKNAFGKGGKGTKTSIWTGSGQTDDFRGSGESVWGDKREN